MSDSPNVPADWYEDPEDATQFRYWDGAQWTDHRAPRYTDAAVTPAAEPVAEPIVPVPEPAAEPAPAFVVPATPSYASTDTPAASTPVYGAPPRTASRPFPRLRDPPPSPTARSRPVRCSPREGC